MTEEVFHRGIVPAIASSGHRRLGLQFLSQAMVILRAIQNSLVTMQDDAGRLVDLLARLLEGTPDECPRVLRTDLMRDDKTIIEVLDRREIRPALLCSYIGYICDPLLIRLYRRKVTLEHIGVAVEHRHPGATPVGFAPAGNRANA
jgi:hypothetical protein